MEQKIYKYPVSIDDVIRIQMPLQAEFLTLQVQNDIPCLWVLVDPENELEERIFEMYGTGYSIECNSSIERKYLGTFQLREGILVYHLFERIPEVNSF